MHDVGQNDYGVLYTFGILELVYKAKNIVLHLTRIEMNFDRMVWGRRTDNRTTSRKRWDSYQELVLTGTSKPITGLCSNRPMEINRRTSEMLLRSHSNVYATINNCAAYVYFQMHSLSSSCKKTQAPTIEYVWQCISTLPCSVAISDPISLQETPFKIYTFQSCKQFTSIVRICLVTT